MIKSIKMINFINKRKRDRSQIILINIYKNLIKKYLLYEQLDFTPDFTHVFI